MVRQVLGLTIADEGVENLRSHKFSIIPDETTERATTTQLAILAIYFDIDEYKMKLEGEH